MQGPGKSSKSTWRKLRGGGKGDAVSQDSQKPHTFESMGGEEGTGYVRKTGNKNKKKLSSSGGF